jgi:hypothetical protein
MGNKYILQLVYTETLKKVWKLTIKDKYNVIIDSKIYDSLGKANKKIKETVK